MWKVRERKISARTFYEVIKVISEDIIVPRGGLWETRAEAEKLANTLNKEEAEND